MTPQTDEDEPINSLIPLDDANAGSPLGALRADAMPSALVYIRSNLEVPTTDPETWRLAVGGLVESPAGYSLPELQEMSGTTELVTVECAGNGRLLMDPVPDGAPWELGAVSVAEFTGVPLRRVLETSIPAPEAIEFVFTGADRGSVEPEGSINYAFNLQRDAALGDGPLLAWAMNGAPLSPDHGSPMRLVVPGTYGMNSVKWLTTITAIDEPFTGHFRQKYRYFGDPVEPETAPVGRIRVRSLIVTPEDGGRVAAGPIEVQGIAWSGHGAIESVEVAAGAALQDARLGSVFGRFGPTPWAATVTLDPGAHTLSARARDEAGNTQPLEPIWNRNGYANNVVHRIEVAAEH